MASARIKIVYTLFILAFLFLQYCLWFQKGGIHDMQALKQKLALQVKENKSLQVRNKALLAEINNIQQSKDVAESRARSELGMIKEGETFYQIVN